MIVFVGCNVDSEVKISAKLDSSQPAATPAGEGGAGEGGASLVFEEDFEYKLSNGSINTNFLSDSGFQNKWDTYSLDSTHALSTHDGSIKWSPDGTSWWGASLITKQTFNLPISIEFTLEHSLGYSSASAFEGICLTDATFNDTQRRDKYAYPINAPLTNFGCLMMAQQTNITENSGIYTNGIFLNSSFFNSLGNDQVVTNGTPSRTHYIFTAGLSAYNKITITIGADLVYEITVYDENNVVRSFSSSLNNNITNFNVEVHSSDYSSGKKSYFDNIKIYNYEIAPSGF